MKLKKERKIKSKMWKPYKESLKQQNRDYTSFSPCTMAITQKATTYNSTAKKLETTK